jgi:hypothetical protein
MTLSQPCAHPDASAHHTTVRTRDGHHAHICSDVPAAQEWIDALLLLAEGLSTTSGGPNP